MLKWNLISVTFLLFGSETNTLLDEAMKAQSLTDRGVWIGLVITGLVLLIMYSKLQFKKEETLIDRTLKASEECAKRLERVTEEMNKVVKENTAEAREVRISLEGLRENIRDIDSHQQKAADAAEERHRKKFGQ